MVFFVPDSDLLLFFIVYSCAVELPSFTLTSFIESLLDISIDVPILACILPDCGRPFSGAVGSDSVILLRYPSLFLAPFGSTNALFPILFYWKQFFRHYRKGKAYTLKQFQEILVLFSLSYNTFKLFRLSPP